MIACLLPKRRTSNETKERTWQTRDTGEVYIQRLRFLRVVYQGMASAVLSPTVHTYGALALISG